MIVVVVRGVKMNGIINSGFNIIGRLNIIGLLILKIFGVIFNFFIVL